MMVKKYFAMKQKRREKRKEKKRKEKKKAAWNGEREK